ncbi:Dps family protein [Myroides sp. LJL116]
MKLNIGLSQDIRKATVETLSKLVADEFVLFTKTRSAHYNVEGIDFHAMHVFFEEQYTQIEENVDAIAERIRQLGFYAPSSLKQYIELTQLKEVTNTSDNKSSFWIKELLTDHETIINFLRDNIETINDVNDIGTADFLTALLESHEKQAWMLRAHIA